MALNLVLFISTQPLCHSPWWCRLVHYPTNQFEMILHHTLSLALVHIIFLPCSSKSKIRSGVTVSPWLHWSSLYSSGGPQTHRDQRFEAPPRSCFIGKETYFFDIIFVTKEMHKVRTNTCCANLAKASPISSLSDVMLHSFGQNSVKRKHVSDIKKNIDKNSRQ